MFDGHMQGSEFQKGQARYEEGATQAHEEISANIASLMRSALIGASYNAPVRAAAMQGLQQTHGNRAVQRALQTSGLTSHIAVQRDSTEDEEAKDARKGRTAVSNTARAAREGTKAATQASAAATAQKEAALAAYTKTASAADPEAMLAAGNEYEKARRASQLVDSSKSKFGSWMEANTGRTSTVGRGLRGANYGLQFWENMSKGQGIGEAGFGAAAGGATSNYMSSYLFGKSRGVGWADTAVNLLNAGLNLAGAPEEVTTFTQVAADATPSSMATNLASNAGRGLWNAGEALITGDASGLKQQGEDITHGKSGVPLQGYGNMVELLSFDRERYGEITDEMRAGKRGKFQQKVLQGKDWVSDKWDSAMGRGTKAQRENREKGMEHLHFEHLREARKEKLQKEQFEKEMAALTAQIEKGPSMPGTMLGGPGDALSAKSIWAQAPQYDEDGELIPQVSMALPSAPRKKRR